MLSDVIVRKKLLHVNNFLRHGLLALPGLDSDV